VSSGDVFTAAQSFTVPTTVRGSGRLYIYASRGYFDARRNQPLDKTIAQLQKVPRGYDLTMYVRFRGAHSMRFTIPTDWPLKGYADPIGLKLLK
jgi:hypothetical protein